MYKVVSPTTEQKRKETWCEELKRLYCPREEEDDKEDNGHVRKLDFDMEEGRGKTALQKLKF